VKRDVIHCLFEPIGVYAACILVLLASGCRDGTPEPTSSSSPPVSLVSSSTTSTTQYPMPTGPVSTAAAQPDMQSGLPDQVAAMRRSIFVAAWAHDYAALERLAGDSLRFTFGLQEGGPAAFWQAAEAGGDPVLATLTSILNMPYGLAEGNYVWPFAHALDFSTLTGDQMNQLRTYFSDADIQKWIDFGGYFGYRVGINEAGTWLYYVEGD
jgi:hypothetical protein